MIGAVYPGTFDPLTRGHEDLVRRASVLFGTVIVGVADSRAKKPFFTLTERVQAPPFQGHRLNRLEGTWAASELTLPAGTIRVPTDGPLGRLAFHLLEPESLDGLAAWNFLDESLAVGERYPIVKLY